MSEHHYHYMGVTSSRIVQDQPVAGSPCHRPVTNNILQFDRVERMRYCPTWLPTEPCDCEVTGDE